MIYLFIIYIQCSHPPTPPFLLLFFSFCFNTDKKINEKWYFGSCLRRQLRWHLLNSYSSVFIQSLYSPGTPTLSFLLLLTTTSVEAAATFSNPRNHSRVSHREMIQPNCMPIMPTIVLKKKIKKKIVFWLFCPKWMSEIWRFEKNWTTPSLADNCWSS